MADPSQPPVQQPPTIQPEVDSGPMTPATPPGQATSPAPASEQSTSDAAPAPPAMHPSATPDVAPEGGAANAHAGDAGTPMLKQAIANHAPPPSSQATDERSASSAPPAREPPPLSIRVEARRVEGLNKPAIVAAAGAVLAGILILAAMGLSAKPQSGPQARKELMGAPARRTLAEAQVGELPKTYADVDAFTPGNETGTVDVLGSSAAAPPILGPPMAGDMAAFAPDGARSPIHGPDGFTDHGYTPGTSAPASVAYGAPGGAATAGSVVASGPNEADIARRSGLFFRIAALNERPQTGHDALNDGVPSTNQGPESLGALEAASTRNDQRSKAKAAPARRSIHPGTVIPASLLTAINSEAPGPVIAQVTSPVYDSETGDHIVIPQGARLIGAYKSTSRYGQRRIEIAWNRIVLRDGLEIALDEPAVDARGASGLSGRVDNHWGEVFAAAALGTAINVGAAATEDTDVTVLGALGVRTSDPVERAARNGLGQATRAITERVIDRGLAIPPTVRAPAGSRVAVLATRQVVISPLLPLGDYGENGRFALPLSHSMVTNRANVPPGEAVRYPVR